MDINKFPSDQGLILCGISMNRIGNIQSPQKCLEYLNHLVTKIEHTEGIGLVMLYSDYLYMHAEDPAYKLRDRYKELMVSHKNAFLSLLKKEKKWTLKAFSFKTFGQLILDNSDVFPHAFSTVQELYNSDAEFKTLVDGDVRGSAHGVGEREVRFILEEITTFYLAQKGVLKLENRFVTDSDKRWVLQAYPGEALKSEAYLFQKNPLNLSWSQNKYENASYDLGVEALTAY